MLARTQSSEGLLYEISLNGKKSFLFGTCHLPDPEIKKLSVEAKKAFLNASQIIVEIDTENLLSPANEIIQSLINKWISNNNQTTNRLPGAVRAILEVIYLYEFGAIKFNRQVLEVIPLFFLYWDMQIETMKRKTPYFLDKGPQDQKGLDSLLIRQAKLLGKPVVDLETFEEQITILLGLYLTREEQRTYFDLLFFSDEMSIDKIEKNILTAVENYLLRNCVQYAITINFPNDEKNEKHEEAYAIAKRAYQELIDNRDEKMATKLYAQHLHVENSFIAVGADHLPGLVAHLARMGCDVKPIAEGPRLYPLDTITQKQEYVWLQKPNGVLFKCKASDVESPSNQKTAEYQPDLGK